MTAPMLSEGDRNAILEAEIRRYIVQGYRLTARTPTTAQLVRPKSFSVATAILWTLLLVVGLVIYLLMYAARSDEAVYLTVDEFGTVNRLGSQPDQEKGWTLPDDRWTCANCQRPNAAQFFECNRCGTVRPSVS